MLDQIASAFMFDEPEQSEQPEQCEQDEQETGIYKTPTSVKRKPKSPRKPRAPRIYKPKEPKQPKPNKPVKSPRKPPKPKNQNPKPHRHAVVRTNEDGIEISPRTGKPKRKYTRKAKPHEPEQERQEKILDAREALHYNAVEQMQEESSNIFPVQDDVHDDSQHETQQAQQVREPTYTLNFHHVSPSYLYQLAKHRTFKLVTKQEQGEYVPAQVDEHGVTIVPSYIAAGRTVPAGQCSKCRANASPRIPIYYSTFETSDGWPLPYLCDRCYEVVRLWKWNAEFCEPLPMVLHYYEASMHESLHCKGLEA
jgi:hypothetical protein